MTEFALAICLTVIITVVITALVVIIVLNLSILKEITFKIPDNKQTEEIITSEAGVQCGRKIYNSNGNGPETVFSKERLLKDLDRCVCDPEFVSSEDLHLIAKEAIRQLYITEDSKKGLANIEQGNIWWDGYNAAKNVAKAWK